MHHKNRTPVCHRCPLHINPPRTAARSATTPFPPTKKNEELYPISRLATPRHRPNPICVSKKMRLDGHLFLVNRNLNINGLLNRLGALVAVARLATGSLPALLVEAARATAVLGAKVRLVEGALGACSASHIWKGRQSVLIMRACMAATRQTWTTKRGRKRDGGNVQSRNWHLLPPPCLAHSLVAPCALLPHGS